MGKISKRTVDAAPVGKTLWDGELPGFGLRVSDDGVKSFVIKYRHFGAQRWMTVGRYGVLTPDEARDAARRLLAAATLGGDPASERMQAKRRAGKDAAKGRTVADYLEKYLRWPAHRARKSAVAVEAALRRDMLSLIGTKAIDAVTVADVKAIRDAKVEAGAVVASNRTLTYTRHFFRWLAQEGHIPADPAASVQKALKHETPRDRYLSDAEIPILWRACSGMVAPYGDFIRFALLAGQRRGEIVGMRWADVDFGAKVWRLAADQTKTGVATVVPLSAPALAILDGLPRYGETVFATSTGLPLQNWGRATAKINAACAFDRPFTIHDLRRTLRTGLAALRVSGNIAELILNHSAGSRIQQTYDHHAYGDEKRDALDRWAAHVMGLIEERPAKVVVMNERKRANG